MNLFLKNKFFPGVVFLKKRFKSSSVRRNQERYISYCIKKFIVKKFLKIADENISFGINDKGRPFLKNFRDFDFNVSHSNGYIAVIFSKYTKVGIDIEFLSNHRNTDAIAKKFFSTNENFWLHRLSSKKEDFYILWTLKESILKMNGKGISCSGFMKYPFKFYDGKVYLMDSSSEIFFQTFIYNKHIISICSSKKASCIRLNIY